MAPSLVNLLGKVVGENNALKIIEATVGKVFTGG
jgi:hypothetical protein